MGIMRWAIILFYCLLSLCAVSLPSEKKTKSEGPRKFVIGRHTFIDVGPPNDYYEILLVRSAAEGSSEEKITLTPAVDVCFHPAEVEIRKATLNATIPDLLGPVDPCAVPEKSLQTEMERRKKELVFSGANVVMQVACGTQVRLIRSDILDRNLFDSAPNTPEYTSWTMQLLEKLDEPLGPGVWDRPAFPGLSGDALASAPPKSGLLDEIRAGKYDSLFQGAPDKPSELCHQAEKPPPPPPTIKMVSSDPVWPVAYPWPGYPPILKLVHLEGTVSAVVEIDEGGSVTSSTCEKGHPLLCKTALNIVKDWKFPNDSSKRQVKVTLEFALNCHKPTNSR